MTNTDTGRTAPIPSASDEDRITSSIRASLARNRVAEAAVRIAPLGQAEEYRKIVQSFVLLLGDADPYLLAVRSRDAADAVAGNIVRIVRAIRDETETITTRLVGGVTLLPDSRIVVAYEDAPAPVTGEEFLVETDSGDIRGIVERVEIRTKAAPRTEGPHLAYGASDTFSISVYGRIVGESA